MKLLWIFVSIALSYQVVQATSKPCRNPDNPSVFYYKITTSSKSNDFKEKTKEARCSSEELYAPKVEEVITSFKEFMENYRDLAQNDWESYEEQGLDSMNNLRESFEDLLQEFEDYDLSELDSENGLAYYEDFREQFKEFIESFGDVVFYGNNECVTLKQWTSLKAPPPTTFII